MRGRRARSARGDRPPPRRARGSRAGTRDDTARAIDAPSARTFTTPRFAPRRARRGAGDVTANPTPRCVALDDSVAEDRVRDAGRASVDCIVRAGGRVVDGRGSIERRANDGARSRRSGGGEDDARAGRVRGRVSTAFDHGTFSRGRAVLWIDLTNDPAGFDRDSFIGGHGFKRVFIVKCSRVSKARRADRSLCHDLCVTIDLSVGARLPSHFPPRATRPTPRPPHSAQMSPRATRSKASAEETTKPENVDAPAAAAVVEVRAPLDAPPPRSRPFEPPWKRV